MAWRTTTVLFLVCVAGLVVSLWWYAFRRPLFHETYTSEKTLDCPLFPHWTLTYAVVDRAGVIGFFDIHENLFVVIATDDENISIHWTKVEARPSEAVLLVGTPHEVRVRSQRNTLIIIEGDVRHSFPIEPRQAWEWQHAMAGLTQTPGRTVLGDIARTYHGERKEVIEDMAARVAERVGSAGGPGS